MNFNNSLFVDFIIFLVTYCGHHRRSGDWREVSNLKGGLLVNSLFVDFIIFLVTYSGHHRRLGITNGEDIQSTGERHQI